MEDESVINYLVGLPTADQRRAATTILRTDVLAAVRALAGCQRCGFVEQVLSAFDPSTLVTNSSLTYNHNSAATSWDNASHPTAPSVMPPAQLLALLSASGNPSELVGLLQFAWRDPTHGGSGSPEAPPSGGSGSSSSGGGWLALSDSLLGNTRLLRRFLTQSLGVMQALSEELGDCRRHAGCPGPSELAASLARLHTQRRHTRERLAAWGVLLLGDSGGGQQQEEEEEEEEGQQEGEPHGGRQQRGGQELTRQQEGERPVEGSGAKGAVKEAGGGGGAEEEGGGDDPQLALAIRLSLQEAAAAAAEEGEEERTGSATTTTSSSTPPAPPGSYSSQASHHACMVNAAAVAALPAGLRERVEHLVSQLRAVEQRLGRLQHACQHGVQAGGRKLLLLLLQLMWSNLRRHYRAAAAEAAADVGRGQAAGRRAAAAEVGAAGDAEQLGGHECPMGHLARLRRRQRRYEGVLAELAAGLSDEEEEGGDVEEAGLGEGFDASLLSLQERRATGAESASRQGGVPHEEAAGQRQRRRQGRESGGQQEVLGQSSGMEARRSLTASAAAAATGKVAAAHATPARMASRVAAAGSATATGARATTEERLEGDRDAAAAPRVAGSSNSSRPQVARLPAPVPASPVSTFAAVEHTSTPTPPHARASPHHTTPARPTPIPAATQQPHEPMTVVLDYAAAAGGGAAPAVAAGCGGVGSHAHGGGVAGTDSGSGLESGCSSGCSSSNSSCCCSCGAADCRTVREEQAEQLQALQCQLSACRASQSELQGEVGRLLDMLAHSRRAGEQAVSSLQSQLSRMRGEAEALAGLGPEELGRLAGEMEAALGRVRAAQLQAAAAREQQCPVCWERRKELVFGCGHQTCGECGERLSACPICRTTISIRIRVYG